MNLARCSESYDGFIDRGERSELFDCLEAATQVLDLRHGKRGIVHVDARSALADVEELVFISIGQGLEQDRADDGEDGRVGADAQGERKSDGDPERGSTPEGAQGDFQVIRKQGEEGHGYLPESRRWAAGVEI